MNRLLLPDHYDIEGLLSSSLAELGGLIRFRRARAFASMGPEGIELLLEELLSSPRQRQRAAEALASGLGFWDRIDGCAMVPVLPLDGVGADGGGERSPKGFAGMAILEGLDRDISPLEAQRLLPMLSALLSEKVVRAKLHSLAEDEEGVPSYLDVANVADAALLKISFHRPVTARDADRLLEGLEAFGGRAWTLAGLGPDTIWSLGHGVEPSMVSRLARELYSCRKGKMKQLLGGKRPKGILVVSQGHGGWRRRIAWMAGLCHILGAALFTPEAAAHMEEFTSLPALPPQEEQALISPWFEDSYAGAGRAICLLHATKGARGGMADAVSALRVHGAMSQLVNPDLQGQLSLDSVRALSDRVMAVALRLGPGARSESSLREVTESLAGFVARHLGVPVTAGCAAAFMSRAVAANLMGSAVWALWHALLLDENTGRPGNVALFDWLSLNVKGDVLLSWGDLPGAVAAYRRGLRLKPDEKDMANSLGTCLAALGRRREAEEVFLRAIEADESDFMAHYNLSGLYQEQGRVDDARTMAQKAATLAPDELAVRYRLAETMFAAGDIEGCLEVCEAMGSSTSQAPEGMQVALLRLEARAFLALRQWKKARASLSELIRRRSSDPVGLLLLADGFLNVEEDLATARRFFSRLAGPEGLPADLRPRYHRIARRLGGQDLRASGEDGPSRPA